MLSLTWALNTAVQALQGPGSRAASGADQHPFLTPRYREPGFPAAAQFLDSQWEKARLGGQHRGTQSGLRPVSPDHLLHIEPACYVEQMRQKAVLVGGLGVRAEGGNNTPEIGEIFTVNTADNSDCDSGMFWLPLYSIWSTLGSPSPLP